MRGGGSGLWRRPQLILLSTEIRPTPTATDSLRVSHKSEEVVLPLHVPLRSLWTAIVKSVRVGKSLGVGSEKAGTTPAGLPLLSPFLQ